MPQPCRCAIQPDPFGTTAELFVSLVPPASGTANPSPLQATLNPPGADSAQPFIALSANATALSTVVLNAKNWNAPQAPVDSKRLVVPVNPCEISWTVKAITVFDPKVLPGQPKLPRLSITGSKSMNMHVIGSSAAASYYTAAAPGATVQGSCCIIRLDIASLWIDWLATPPPGAIALSGSSGLHGKLLDFSIDIDCTAVFTGGASPPPPITKHMHLVASGQKRAAFPRDYYAVTINNDPPHLILASDIEAANRQDPLSVTCTPMLQWEVSQYAVTPPLGTSQRQVTAGDLFTLEVDVDYASQVSVYPSHQDCHASVTAIATARAVNPEQLIGHKVWGSTTLEAGTAQDNGAPGPVTWQESGSSLLTLLSQSVWQTAALFSAGAVDKPTTVKVVATGQPIEKTMAPPTSAGAGPGLAGSVVLQPVANFEITIIPNYLKLCLFDLTGGKLAGRFYDIPQLAITRQQVPADGNLDIVLPAGLSRLTLALYSDDDPAITTPACSFDISVGDLWDVDSNLGLRSRLNNLGYAAGADHDNADDVNPLDAIGLGMQARMGVDWDSKAVWRAIERFQTANGLATNSSTINDPAVTGDPTPATQASLQKLHDLGP